MLVTPGKKYTVEQIKQLMTVDGAKDLEMKGYVARVDDQGYVSFHHWTKATNTAKGLKGKTYTQEGAVAAMQAELPPIVKRTPQERVDSLMLRFIDDCKRAGTVPGLDDVKVGFLVGEAWKSGRSEVTGEMVRQVAQSFLDKAEKEREAANFKRTVRI